MDELKHCTTEDLIQELANRSNSLVNKMKIEFLMENIDKIKLEELEKLVK